MLVVKCMLVVYKGKLLESKSLSLCLANSEHPKLFCLAFQKGNSYLQDSQTKIEQPGGGEDI